MIKNRCFKGHEYSEENTYWNKGRRQCNTCRQFYGKVFWLKHKK